MGADEKMADAKQATLLPHSLKYFVVCPLIILFE